MMWALLAEAMHGLRQTGESEQGIAESRRRLGPVSCTAGDAVRFDLAPCSHRNMSGSYHFCLEMSGKAEPEGGGIWHSKTVMKVRRGGKKQAIRQIPLGELGDRSQIR
ncbi:hypothetical protein NDU88_004952 [Pleurodeles waltl]|uniref:Uncharacterized protein n=1 Tax=Pleurodeles waltl TaxID=8319 RepID=A0AAV7W873_PLEWA|nr:hypothetical protein NDU88_004952 [Pleurodeles waltl]